MPCRAGCSACCHGPFDISVADVVLIRDALARLPDSDRGEIQRSAVRQMKRMRELEPAWDMMLGLGGISDAAFDRLSDAMAETPCVFLNSAGDCRIYESRPLVCRMIGLGVVTPAGRVIENECPIQGDFPAYAHLPPQPLDMESLEEREDACLEAASVEVFGTPHQVGYETTIAGSLDPAHPFLNKTKLP